MNLSPDQIAAAEFAGVRFLTATPDQIRRLSMQRKVFRVGETAVLATRDGSFFETAATLTSLIEEGEQQRRDLAAWQEADVETALAARESTPEPPSRPPEIETAEPPVKVKRRVGRPRKDPTAAEPLPCKPKSQPAKAVPSPALFGTEGANKQLEEVSSPTQSPPTPRARAARKPREPHWMTAGAERRGRAAQHWSTRYR